MHTLPAASPSVTPAWFRATETSFLGRCSFRQGVPAGTRVDLPLDARQPLHVWLFGIELRRESWYIHSFLSPTPRLTRHETTDFDSPCSLYLVDKRSWRDGR